MDQVLLLAVVVRACVHNIVQVLPEQINKYKSSSIWLLYDVGIDLEGGQLWAKEYSTPLSLKTGATASQIVNSSIRQVLGLGDLLAK